MSKKFILVSLAIVCLFFVFGFEIGVNATDQSLVSFSSGALLVEKPPEYSSEWGSIWIIDENPKTGWCCLKGKILDNVLVIELAEESVFNRLEFDTGHADAKGRGAKDIIVELSDDGPTEGFTEIAGVSLTDQKDNQSFPVTVDKSGKWLRLIIQNNHGDSQWTELMDFRAFGKQLTKTPLPDVSGTYETNYNDFHLRQQETSVTGCYEYNKGLLNGDIEGRTVKFTWREPSQKGPAVIIFTSDGEKFFGFRWYEGREDSRGEIWNGIKKSQDVGGCPHWAGRAQEQLIGFWQEGQEFELNDTKEQANELKLGESVEGFFQETGDQDWYKLTVNIPGKNIIRIDLSAVPEIESEIQIYDEKGNHLKTYNAGEKGEAEAVINLGVTEGIYYIEIGAHRGRGMNQNDSYTLKTQLIGPWQEGQEFELNEQKEWANELKLGESVEGLFQETGDKDWYKLIVNIPGKNIIRIDLSAVPEVNSEIQIYNEKGQRLKTYNAGEKGEAEAVINLGVTEGIYYIEIRAHRGRGMNQNVSYTLKTQLIGPWQEGQEFELNEQKEWANELKLGESVEGLFPEKGDQDWYKLTVNVPGKNVIRIDLSAVPEVNSEIQIYNEKGQRLKTYNAGEKGEAEAVINLGVTEGIYYIVVRAQSGMNQNVSYTLKTQLIGPWQEGQEFELNEQKEWANELKLGESVEGLFPEKGDQDWYKLTVNVPGKNVIRIDLSAVPEVNSEIQIYNEQGRQLKIYNVGKEGEAEAVINLGVIEGIYYIVVRAQSGMNRNGSYNLKTQLISPWQEGQEFELNDQIEQANELKLEQIITGYIFPENDNDWYTVTVPEEGLDILVVELSAVPQVNLSLTLLDDAGKQLKKMDISDKGEEEVIVRMKCPSGKYYVRVWGRQANSVESYTLRVGKPTVQPATAEEVSQALTRALDYLSREQAKEGYWSQSRNDYKVGIAGLALQAFIGGECAPKDYSSNIKAAINFLKTEYNPSSEYQSGTKDRAIYGGLIAKGNSMYEHAIATLALIEALVEMNDLSLAPLIEDALQLIIRAQNTEHKPELLGGPINVDSKNYGGWRYNPDSTDSDISITDWQILALKGALSAGFSIPDWSLPKAADYLRSLYHEDYHSFGYSSPGGGCARAGMGVLGLQLSGYPDDPRINPALRYMQDNPPVWEDEEPGDGYPFYYWYYGSRAMLLAGGEYWRIWKAWTCRLLVDHQNGDGSWVGAQKEKGMEVYTTALGALMLELCCGHLPVYMHEKVRIPIIPGSVKVNFKEGLAQETTKNVELILDASNSMWGQIKGESKISIAKEVLKQIIVGLPEDLNVGLRLYGHRYKVKDERACQDTELIIPIGPLQKDQLIQTIEKITPRGKTPLVYSILQSPQDFINLKGGTVVLISDGIESCEGDIESIASKLKESGIELKVNIIGFSIKEEEARKQLETIAKSTGGIYLDAKDSQELLSSLQQTLKIEYDLIDEKGEVKASGYVGGEAVSILEGEYILQLKLEPTLLETKVVVNPAKTSIFLLKREEGKWTIKPAD